MTPTSTSRRRSTNALVNWVVPIMTDSIAPGAIPACASTSPTAATIPPPTSAVVGDLPAPTTAAPRRITASVFVPPTSTPIRIVLVSSRRRLPGLARVPDDSIASAGGGERTHLNEEGFPGCGTDEKAHFSPLVLPWVWVGVSREGDEPEGGGRASRPPSRAEGDEVTIFK